MKCLSTASVALAGAALLAGSAAAAVADNMDPIVIKGSKFFYKNSGEQFFMKGVAYQQEVGPGGAASADNTKYNDPLADVTACKRDVPLLKELNTNIIRVYAVDPKADHDECMQLLADAGIYVIADLSQPDQSINRDDPTWNDDLYGRYTSVVDSLQGYNNVMGFFAGNEVSNQANNTVASAFVKAAVRDTKAYIKAKKYREIGVGYATNDDQEIRVDMEKYFNCGDKSDSIDFWGYNIYSWCGESTYEKSKYNERTKEFASYNVPVFFAEYGCNEVTPRPFTEVKALYGSQMTPVWSGGIVYMYHQEANNYGLVKIDSSGKASKLQDFTNLSKQIATATPTGVKMNDYSPTNTAAAQCPDVNDVWQAKASPLPPTVVPELCTCMMSSLSCVVNSNVNEEDYSTLFQQVCGYGDDICTGILANATTGVFGAYSICNPREKLSFVMDRYYKDQNKRTDACDFDGAASIQTAKTTGSSCSSLMQDAGENGQGTLTAAPGSTSTGGDGDSGASLSMGVSVVLSALAALSASFFVLA